jgi:uncharacterized protein involved in type VI secretion and phage assembly
MCLAHPANNPDIFHGISLSFSQGAATRVFHYRAGLCQRYVADPDSRSRIFQNKTVPQISTEVLEGYEVDKRSTPGIQGDNYCAQYRRVTGISVA